MNEVWLQAPNSNFHNLVSNTRIDYPLCLDRKDAINFLKLIGHPDFYYGSFHNYDIIDYKKLIYIEMSFQDDLEIQELLKEIKQFITEAFIYKHQYIKRITNPIPRERFEAVYDDFMTGLYDFPVIDGKEDEIP
jgi:hypothetical protein